MKSSASELRPTDQACPVHLSPLETPVSICTPSPSPYKTASNSRNRSYETRRPWSPRLCVAPVGLRGKGQDACLPQTWGKEARQRRVQVIWLSLHRIKKTTHTGKTKICVFRDAAFIAIIGNQRNFLLNGNKTVQIISLRANILPARPYLGGC